MSHLEKFTFRRGVSIWISEKGLLSNAEWSVSPTKSSFVDKDGDLWIFIKKRGNMLQYKKVVGMEGMIQ